MMNVRALIGFAAAACMASLLSTDSALSETASDLTPYVPSEPAALYVPEAMDSTTHLWIKYSRRAALHGDLTSAIEQMQIATNALVQRRNDDFELWDNLAELYCARASRERDPKQAEALRANGRAMLAEFRCGMKVFSGSTYDMSCKTKRGFVPNSAFTPLCYQLFCSQGPRDKGAAAENPAEEDTDAPDLYALYLAKFREDAADLNAIESVCRMNPKR